MSEQKEQKKDFQRHEQDRLIDEAHKQIERHFEKKRHIENQSSRLFRLILTSLGLFLTVASIVASLGFPFEFGEFLGIEIWSLSEEFTRTFPLPAGFADFLTYLLFLILISGTLTTFLDLVFFTPYWAYQVLSPTPSKTGPSDIQSLAKSSPSEVDDLVLKQYINIIEQNEANIEGLEASYQKLWHHITRGVVLGGIIVLLVYPAFFLQDALWAILAFSAVLLAILSLEDLEKIQTSLADFNATDEWVDKSLIFIFVLMFIGMLPGGKSLISGFPFHLALVVSGIIAFVSAFSLDKSKVLQIILRNSLVFLLTVFLFLSLIAVDPTLDHVPEYIIVLLLSIDFAIFFNMIPLVPVFLIKLLYKPLLMKLNLNFLK